MRMRPTDPHSLDGYSAEVPQASHLPEHQKKKKKALNPLNMIVSRPAGNVSNFEFASAMWDVAC